MTVEKAISTIIKQQGIEILGFPNQVQSMIMDYVSGNERDVQLFCLSCQKGLLRYAQKLVLLKKDADVQDIALQAKIMLQHDAYMSEEYAIHCINMLLSGLGFAFEIISNINEKEQEEKKDKIAKIKQPGLTRYSARLSNDNIIEIDGNILQELRDSAQKGNVSALLTLGNCYFHGVAVTEDWIIAEYYYRKAKELGNNNEKKEAENRLNEIHNKRQADL